jgi:VanZ family protein
MPPRAAAAAILFWPALPVVVWDEVFVPLHLLDRANDKILHFIAYLGLAAMVAAAFKGRCGMVWAGRARIVMGGAFEIVQGYGGRDMSFGDELANISGTLLGGGMAQMLVERLRRQFGDW